MELSNAMFLFKYIYLQHMMADHGRGPVQSIMKPIMRRAESQEMDTLLFSKKVVLKIVRIHIGKFARAGLNATELSCSI